MSRTTHVVRRGATYYFRLRVPADLVDHYGKQEITFSLKTKDQAEANVTSRYFWHSFARFLSQATTLLHHIICACFGTNPAPSPGFAIDR
ncbi:DUF6538 domain-containing protein [Vogesella sp. EB]|uniref:DUF6538 domain-containing protein n=1 Tax=Vogesella sp. EB TaxID=1526735 RepID=UPI003510C874